MRKLVIFMFSGQGSHYYQMGLNLYEENPLFKYWMEKADELCQDLIGVSIIKELYHPHYKKSDPFTNIILTHPAIFMVEHALAQVLIDKGVIPNYVLGASLGEFAAATIAGIIPFEIALQAVIKQAQLIDEKCQPGSMLAIFHEHSTYYDHPLIQQWSELASLNFPSHFVISGGLKQIQEIERYLKAHQLNYQSLNVGYGFHSSFIDESAFDYLEFMKKNSLKHPIIPFISCAYTREVSLLYPSHFWEIARNTIQFQATIKNLEVEKSYSYIDVGPSGTLSTFVKYNIEPSSHSKTFTTITPFSSSAAYLPSIEDM